MTAKRSLGTVRLRYRINDGKVRTAPTKEAPGGEKYNNDPGVYYHRLRGEVITLVHTEVFAAFSGQGHAAVLARGALDDARARGLTVVPSCPYVASYIGKHPDYADLVG